MADKNGLPLRLSTNVLLALLFAVCQTLAAPQELVASSENGTLHIHDHDRDGDSRYHRPPFTAVALGDEGTQDNFYTGGGGGNQSVENMRDFGARNEIQCFRCKPTRDNDYCSGSHVGEKVECLTGRCLILGARLKATNHVSRLYMCDTHNIADWRMQYLKNPDELVPNTCEDIDDDLSNTMDVFRTYGMGPSIAELAGIDRNDVNRPGALAAYVDKLEMCTCNTMLCNSHEALRRITGLKHDDHNERGRSSATSIFNSAAILQVLASIVALLISNTIRLN